MKGKISRTLVVCLLLGTSVAAPVFAIFGLGDIVFDPSNFEEAVQQLLQLEQQYAQLVDPLGRAQAVNYETLEYRPQEAEIKYFLIDFVQRQYSRMRATVRENYARSLYFLDGRLADAIIEANKKSKAIETFFAGGSEEIEVHVANVSIEDLRNPPYKATVDFEKVYYGAADHQEVRREKYIANFVFVVKERVPNSMIPVNPLGLTIIYFREDQAFQ